MPEPAPFILSREYLAILFNLSKKKFQSEFSARPFVNTMALATKPYFGLTGGWLTFWITVRLRFI